MTGRSSASRAVLSVLLWLSVAGGCELDEGRDRRAPPAAESATPSEEPHPPPWVILYVLDTLRFDDVYRDDGLVGDPGALSRIARDGLQYTRAHSTSSWTRPAAASLLTGVLSSDHAVYSLADPIRDGIPLLQEALQEAGYETVAVSSNPNILPRWGFGRGFERFLDVKGVPGEFDPQVPSLKEQILAVVDEKRDRPLFLYVHDNGPHHPYLAPPDLRARYGAADAPSEAMFLAADPKPEHIESAQRLHVAAVHLATRRLAALLGALDEQGRYDDALVVVVGDHGEEFGEHGRVHHAQTLYQEVLQVPLFVKAPRVSPAEVTRSVSLTEVAPSVLGWLGLPAPDVWAGRSLPVSDEEASVDGKDDTLFAELECLGHSAGAAIDWPWKYVRQGPDEMLFDLERDPGERRSLSAEEPERVAALRAAFERARGGGHAGLTLACAAGPEESRADIEVALTRGGAPPGRPEARGLEKGDRIIEQEGGFRVDLELTPSAGDRGLTAKVPDRDSVRLPVFPSDAVLEITNHSGVVILGPRGGRLSGDRPIPLASITTRSVPSPLAVAFRPRCRLYHYVPAEPVPVAADPELAARLRALGYVESSEDD